MSFFGSSLPTAPVLTAKRSLFALQQSRNITRNKHENSYKIADKAINKHMYLCKIVE